MAASKKTKPAKKTKTLRKVNAGKKTKPAKKTKNPRKVNTGKKTKPAKKIKSAKTGSSVRWVSRPRVKPKKAEPRGLSELVVKAFWNVCNSAYESWVTRRKLFDDSPRVRKLLSDSYVGPALDLLSKICLEHSLLQVSKLHDPAASGNNRITLSIDYVVRYGAWPETVEKKLKALVADLDKFGKNLKSARNQILAHNDLGAILAGKPLGRFKRDDDVRYFDKLQEFVNIVYDEVVGGPLPFYSVAKNDMDFLVSALRPRHLEKRSPNVARKR